MAGTLPQHPDLSQQIPQQQRQIGQTNIPSYMGIDASEFMKELISNDHIPPEIVKRAAFWTAFGRSTKFSFFDSDDIEYLMLQFEILLVRFKQDVPKMLITPSVLSTLTNIKMEYYANLCRARGNGRMNERELIGVSASANFAERPIEKPVTRNISLLSRLSQSITGR